MVHAGAVGADLVRDGPVRVDHEHPAVLRVGHRDLPVLQQVRVVGLVQVARRGACWPGMAVRPDDLPRRVRELDDGLVLLLVGDDRRAVIGEERVVGEVEAAADRAAAPGDGYRHTTCIAASISSSRLLPRSAMSSLAPKNGEPAPGAPAVPKARSGRSICTAETSAPSDSPPTIQAVDPVTATAA